MSHIRDFRDSRNSYRPPFSDNDSARSGDSYRPNESRYNDRNNVHRSYEFSFRAKDQMNIPSDQPLPSRLTAQNQGHTPPQDRPDRFANGTTAQNIAASRRSRNRQNKATGFDRFGPTTRSSHPPYGAPTAPKGHAHSRYPPPDLASASVSKKENSKNGPLAGLAREKTPEFFLADSGKPVQNKFKQTDNIAHEAEKADSPAAADMGEMNEPSRKKVAIEGQVGSFRPNADVPKWSNPDIYTAIGGDQVVAQASMKGIDLINSIRKARVEQKPTQEANALADGQDFLSLDVGGVDKGRNKREDPLVALDLVKGLPPKPKPALKAKNVLQDGEDVDSALGSRKRGADDQIKVGQPKKRGRHPKGQVALRGSILPEWRAQMGVISSPWFHPKPQAEDSAIDLLTQEMLEFYNFVKPQEFENVLRNDLISRLEKGINKHCQDGHGARLFPFGSFAAGLYLPNGDMDLVVYGKEFQRNSSPLLCQQRKQLFRFSRQLQQSNVALNRSLNVISHAKVPIIKFKDGATGLPVDLSFDNASGPLAVNVYREWMQQYPALPVLASIIKQFLMMRSLNDVATGGLGGYSVVCLIVSLLQHARPEDRQNCGKLLLDFFDFYGNEYDLSQFYISLQPPGRFLKVDNPWLPYNPSKRDRLCIMDPSREGNDISGGSKNVSLIFKVFSEARAEILETMAANEPSQSILSCIIGGDYHVFDDQRNHLRRVWDLNNGKGISSRPSRNPPPGQPRMMGQVEGPPAMLGSHSVGQAQYG